MTDARDRYLGCLVGLAVGDALGTTLEFRRPGTFTPIDDMIGGGPFHLAPGQWTDDTSMALCLAESLIECRGFDPADQIRRYVRWYRTGYLSSTGRCFDIGTTVRRALEMFERSSEPHAGPTAPDTAGNGSIMRLAPVPMYFAGDLTAAVRMSAESSRTTHQAWECLDACRLLGGLIALALNGMGKDELLDQMPPVLAELWRREPLSPRIQEIADGSYRRKDPPEIRGTGYVVESLEAALWALHRAESFREGALLAVNLGDDADTTGAVYGQLAGAVFGFSGIPESWQGKLAMSDGILDYAERLFAVAQSEHEY
jgi:ADP-ribosylglycohydrolase